MNIQQVKSALNQIKKDLIHPDLADREIDALIKDLEDSSSDDETQECSHCGHHQLVEKSMFRWQCLECGWFNRK